jgi:hypothetical protein
MRVRTIAPAETAVETSEAGPTPTFDNTPVYEGEAREALVEAVRRESAASRPNGSNGSSPPQQTTAKAALGRGGQTDRRTNEGR